MIIIVRTIAIIFTIVMVAFSPRLSHADNENPIDLALDRCLATDRGQTTAGMISCTATAIDAWDKKLNEVYQEDMSQLDPKSRELLRTSERLWVSFRDAELMAQAGPWKDNRGTDIHVELLSDDLSAIKERVGELQTYLPSN
jgi:uncharacterized protein YecT (DUF1311 family)